MTIKELTQRIVRRMQNDRRAPWLLANSPTGRARYEAWLRTQQERKEAAT